MLNGVNLLEHQLAVTMFQPLNQEQIYAFMKITLVNNVDALKIMKD